MSTIWTYVSGFIGGMSYTLFIYLHDFRALWIGITWLALGSFARWINQRKI